MDLFEVIITQQAEKQLENHISYIQYTLQNPQAARRVWQDAMDTAEDLSLIAGSMKFCRHPDLQARGYRCIPFRRHRYSMIYHIEGRTVYVDAIYHHLQDYENIFAEDPQDL